MEDLKMIVLDLDGTLLNSDKEISEYTLKKLKDVSDKAKIVLASARGFYRMKSYVDTIETCDENNYTISFNGALVVKNNGERLIDECLSKESLEDIKDLIKKYPSYQWIFYYENGTVNYNESIDEFIKDNNIYKVICLASSEEISKTRKELDSALYEEFEITSSESTRIEFVKKNASKVEAIKKLADILDIKRENIICMGDGENDIEMLRYAGIAVVMDNANQTVKDVATFITASNDEDGVGKAIDRLFS